MLINQLTDSNILIIKLVVSNIKKRVFSLLTCLFLPPEYYLPQRKLPSLPISYPSWLLLYMAYSDVLSFLPKNPLLLRS